MPSHVPRVQHPCNERAWTPAVFGRLAQHAVVCIGSKERTKHCRWTGVFGVNSTHTYTRNAHACMHACMPQHGRLLTSFGLGIRGWPQVRRNDPLVFVRFWISDAGGHGGISRWLFAQRDNTHTHTHSPCGCQILRVCCVCGCACRRTRALTDVLLPCNNHDSSGPRPALRFTFGAAVLLCLQAARMSSPHHPMQANALAALLEAPASCTIWHKNKGQT